jgi:hypothetical protein
MLRPRDTLPAPNRPSVAADEEEEYGAHRRSDAAGDAGSEEEEDRGDAEKGNEHRDPEDDGHGHVEPRAATARARGPSFDDCR